MEISSLIVVGCFTQEGKAKKRGNHQIFTLSDIQSRVHGEMSDCTWLEMQQGSESVSQEQTHPKGLVELGGDKN